MRPHTAAFIAVLNYLYLKSGSVDNVPQNEYKTFRLRVKYSKIKYFDIKIRSISSYRIELELDRNWTCVAQINRSGRSFTISHEHSPNTYVVEKFDLHPGLRIDNGYQTIINTGFEHIRIAKDLKEFDSRGASVLELRDLATNTTYEVLWDGIV